MRRAASVARRPVFLPALAAAVLVVVLGARPAPAQQRTTLTRKERPLASLPFDSTDARSVVVSPDGTRGAFVRPLQGGQNVVVIDGNVSDQPYDELGPNLLTFGPDSRRTAFAGRRGGQWYAVVDGEEGEPFDAVAGESILFSPDGRRVAYLAGLDGKALVVADGTRGPAYDAVAEGSLAFSADGRRLAYVARSGGKEFVVLDGAEGNRYDAVGRPRFSRDGQRLAFAARRGGESFVVVDGAEGRAFPGGAGGGVHPLSLVFSPDGQRLAFVVGPAGAMRAVVDGTEGKAYAQVFDDSIAFSPDGRRVGYVARRAGAANAPNAIVVLDEKEGRAHQAVVPGSVRFSGDGRRWAYLAERAGRDGVVRRVAVVDGVEGPAYDWVAGAPVFSPDGRHFAYVAQRRRVAHGSGSAAAFAQQAGAVGGEARLPPGQQGRGLLPPRRPAAAPAADSGAAAPAAYTGPPGLDGASYESFAVVDGAEAAPYPWVRGDLRFTPDGTRLAYLAAAPDERFLEAGEIPADPANPAAGGRLVFEKPRGDAARIPGKVMRPIKLLLVEERVELE